MKTREDELIIGRRNALKLIGLSSAAMLSAGFGHTAAASVDEAESMVNAAPAVTPSRVAFTTGTDRRAMLPEVLAPFESQIRAGLQGKQLIIKPNMVSTNIPLCATHVDALRGLLEFLKPIYGKQIIIAEASGSIRESEQGFQNYGYLDLQKEFDVKFINLNDDEGSPITIIDKDLHPKQIMLAKKIVDPNNYVISISRLKTHNAVIMTAGVKNMVMGAPLIPKPSGTEKPHYKRDMHAGGPRWLNYNMFLVARQARPSFTIIDGVEGMEGNGPNNGTPVNHKIALAGNDVFAVDSYCAKLMGIPLENIGYLNYGAAEGLGVIDYDKIELIASKDPGQFIIPYKLHENIQTQLGWKGTLNLAQ